MSASDVLRERAQKSSDIVAAYGMLSPDELRALADLLDATAAYIAWIEGVGRGGSGHDAWVLMRNALAAVERAFKGYSDEPRS